MITYHRIPVCLSVLGTDVPFWSVVETAGTIYQKEQQRFHLLLKEPEILDLDPDLAPDLAPEDELAPEATTADARLRLLWLEISAYRVIMTMQGQGKSAYSYRHIWERGMYGTSRYWLRHPSGRGYGQMRLRNYTRTLELKGSPLPSQLRLEYELWSEKLQMGRYVMNLEIHHSG